jgi:Alpha-L-rhamnosidase N-terminal domain
LYELYLNGERVSDELLAPGWTSYHKRLQYQTYDVNQQLQVGVNAIGIILADGWYKGNLVRENHRNIYGDRRGAFFQIHVAYNDGTEEVIVTDTTWKAFYFRKFIMEKHTMRDLKKKAGVNQLGRLSDVLEGGKPLVSSDIHSYMETTEGIRLTVGSGCYHFKYRNERGSRPSYSEDTKLIDFLDYQEAVNLLEKVSPGITKPPRIFSIKTKSLRELVEMPEANLTHEKMHAIIEELNKLEWEVALVK